jgi:hypothetical protein
LVKEGEFRIDITDEITRETLVTKEGHVYNVKVREALGLGELLSAFDTRPPIEIE